MMSIEPPSQPAKKTGSRSQYRKTSPALPKFTQGEIPAESETAFSFLYSAVFTDMLCDGDPTNIARAHGNGELQLELLMLMSGATPVGGADRAITHPEASVCIPLWWKEARPEGLRHLLAIASCAKRAGRVEVLEVALDRIENLHRTAPLDGLYLLAFRKLRIDHTLLTFDGSTRHRRSWAMQRDLALRAVVGCARGDKGKWEEDGRALLQILRALKANVSQHVLSEQSGPKVSPKAIDLKVTEACDAILKILPPRRLPKEALTLLTRAAWLESNAGDRRQRQGEAVAAFQHHITAMAYFWLGKALALKLSKDRETANARVGFSTTEGYVRTVIKLKEFLAAQDGSENNRLRDRLYKSVRSMLDTYVREQGVNKADHIAAAVLECTYVRTTLQPTALLSKMMRPDLPTGDERLTSLSRCLQWLRNGEQEMLSFSGQPAIRVMLCRERILCLIDMLSRLAEHLSVGRVPVKRQLDEGDGAAFRPLVDILINDLRQYGHFIVFMKTYSPGARHVIDEWTQDREHLLWVIKACLDDWRARYPGRYNQSLDLLREIG